MSRSPRKPPTIASSSALSRRRLLASALALPAAALPARLAHALSTAGGAATRAATVTTASAAPGTRAVQQAPYAIVLGTAQDAGVPQVNCFNDNCNAVRAGARPAPRVASLGLIDPPAGGNGPRRYLIDATPDFVAQVGELLAHPDGAIHEGSVTLADHLHGILLTHAHMGHYTGLVHLGREGAAAHELPLYVSAAMAAYLSANEPWAFLVRNGHVALRELQPGVRVALTPRLAITPFEVLHRQELSDTLGFLVHGPGRTLMYVPDADRWQGWPATGIDRAGVRSAPGSEALEPFEHWLRQADVTLLDAAFYSYDELGHRPQGEVPHPPVVVSMDLLGDRLDTLEVWFTHLNNTNPLWDPDSPENATVREHGFGVAEQSQILRL